MTCADCRNLLDAYIDGELPADDAAAVRDHMATCAECSREHALLTATSRRIGEALVRHPAPDVLKARIRSALSQPDAFAQPDVLVTRSAPRRLAFAGLGIAVASSILTFAVIRQVGPDRSLTDDVVSSHIRALMPGHLTDVASTDQHNVKPWFNGRVDLSPPVPRLDSLGFPLIGGRLDYVQGRTMPVVVYGRRQHLISVYSWADSRDTHGTDFSESTRNGYNVVAWRSGGLSLEAVSDLNRPELEQFVKAFSAAR
jgi:anti-sigma factor (TIGR02949 family)